MDASRCGLCASRERGQLLRAAARGRRCVALTRDCAGVQIDSGDERESQGHEQTECNLTKIPEASSETD
eukprot:4677364-Pyramimonas_sp.AAC.1